MCQITTRVILNHGSRDNPVAGEFETSADRRSTEKQQLCDLVKEILRNGDSSDLRELLKPLLKQMVVGLTKNGKHSAAKSAMAILRLN